MLKYTICFIKQGDNILLLNIVQELESLTI